ncbi:FAD-dependent oxidoreductase [Streptomyces niveus]|uniref:FAD-dependent oxidoreductase n=1 Tax=Streptomyces niveus TaxID=193462 RepID=UPI003F4DC680
MTLYEAEPRLGGHAHTHDLASSDGRVHHVDSGFIAHNERTYLLLLRLFGELGVATQESEMSMSVRCDGWPLPAPRSGAARTVSAAAHRSTRLPPPGAAATGRRGGPRRARPTRRPRSGASSRTAASRRTSSPTS